MDNNEYWTYKEQEQYAQRMEDEHSRQNRRIEILEENYKQLTELTICVKEQTMTIDTMSKEIKRQGEQIGKIISEPSDQWQRIKDKSIDTIVGIVVGALVVGFFFLMVPHIK